MRLIRAIFLLTAILGLSTIVLCNNAFCQNVPLDPSTKALCEKVKDVSVPAGDVPTAEEVKTLTGCRSQDFYFGLGAEKDAVKARKCAFAEIEHGASDLNVAGRAILSMIYANAQGVDRNMDLAIKFTCEVQGSPGDVAGNVHELVRYKEGNYHGTNYSFCDHSSGRQTYEQCAALDDRSDKIQREAKLAGIIKAWSPENKGAFSALRKAADAFFADRVASEFDVATTQVQERAFLENDFIAKLEQLERGELPRFSAEDLHKSEDQLKLDLAKVQQGVSFSQGQITAQGINKTEKTWQAYKDAWIAFGKKKYPTVTAESWNAWLTQDRIVMLEKII